MILGVGTDLCSIERIAASLGRFGDRFATRVFTEAERTYCVGRPAAFAKRWAAKEACAKALRTGFRGAIAMTDIAVVNDPAGAPAIRLTGGAKARLDALVPAGHAPRIHLSLTDDHPWAQAFVVIETLPVQELP